MAKKKLTGQFWDKHGDHLYSAFDRGWTDPKDARKKAEAIIQAAACIESWLMLRIPHESESKFTRFLGRVKTGTDVGYIVVRAKSISGGVESWFFVHGLSAYELADKAHRYVDTEIESIDRDRLSTELRRLFKVDMHPEVHNLNRWSASRDTRHRLTLSRARYLIKLAEEGGQHDFTEYKPDAFLDRVAAYMKHDRPLIFDMKIEQKVSLLEETDMLDEEQIRHVAKKLGQHWKLVDTYLGTPSLGAEHDRQTGKFDVHEGESTAVAWRKQKLDEDELPWETTYHPEPTDNDEDNSKGKDGS